MSKDPMSLALKADANLRRRMNEVASKLYSWAPVAEKEAAWKADPECRRLLEVSSAAWARVWGGAQGNGQEGVAPKCVLLA